MSEAYREITGSSNIRPIKKKGMPWPENQEMPPEWIEEGYAYRAKYDLPRINLKLESSRFINSAIAKSRTYTNWHRAWLNWLISPYCKGEPEAAPPKVNHAEEEAVRRVKRKLQGLYVPLFDLNDVRTALAKGVITKEEAKRLGL